jgi:hypothetical protein
MLERKQAGPQDFVAALNGLPLEFVFVAISTADTQKLGVESQVVVVQAVNSVVKELGASKLPKIDVRQVLGLGSSPDLLYLSVPLMKSLGVRMAS